MLVVKLEVWPGGDESRAEEIARATLTNITGPGAVADYQMSIKGPKPQYFEGIVRGHCRRRGPWRLLQLALECTAGGCP